MILITVKLVKFCTNAFSKNPFTGTGRDYQHWPTGSPVPVPTQYPNSCENESASDTWNPKLFLNGWPWWQSLGPPRRSLPGRPWAARQCPWPAAVSLQAAAPRPVYIISVVDLDSVGSASFWRIRIGTQSLPIQIRIHFEPNVKLNYTFFRKFKKSLKCSKLRHLWCWRESKKM